MTTRHDYCADTYTDAMGWTDEAIRGFIRGTIDFIRDAYAPLSSEDVRSLMREVRAARYAGIDRAA